MGVKVSVIVPIYNTDKILLVRCIDSLINQTYDNMEVILVDDGSSWGCRDFLDRCARRYSFVKVIHQVNRGQSSARNAGFKIATGEWVHFVDSDDFIETNTYQYLMNKIDMLSRDVDIVQFNYFRNYKHSEFKVLNKEDFIYNKIYQTKKDINFLQRMTLNFNTNCCYAWIKLIKRDYLEKNNVLFDEKLRQGAEDIEFSFRLYNYNPKVLALDEYLYHYCYNNKSTTTVHSEINHQKVLDCFRKIKSIMNKRDKLLMNTFYDRMCHVILTTAVSGYFSPTNRENYKLKKEKFLLYLHEDIVVEVIDNYKYNNKTLSNIEIITMWFIKHKWFHFVSMIAKFRYLQKNNR